MRKLHRWISTAAMLFLAWVAVTGFVLALDTMFPPAALAPRDESRVASPQAPALDASGAPLATADVLMLAANTLQVALSDRKDTVNSLELQLRMQDGAPRGTVSLAGASQRTYSVDAASGKALEISTQTTLKPAKASTPWYDDLDFRLRWHNQLQDLHRGSIIGLSGQAMDILTGACFVFLSVTGILMYFEMRGRRKQMGRRGWFWR